MIERIKHNKLLLVISILIILLVVLLVSKITYAYLDKPESTPGITEGNITASGDRLIFTKGNDLTLELSTDNFNSSSGNIVATTKPSATLIANKKTEDAIAHYLIGINITENSFVYSTTEKTAELILTVKDETGTIIEEAVGLEPVTVNGVKGFDITEKQGSFNIVTNKEITSKNSDEGETQEWEITLTLINLESDQSVNETASINVDIIMNEFEEINSIEDLVRLSNRVNAGHNFEGAYVVLTKDLDFSKEEDYEDANRTDFGDINGNSNNDPLITELTTGTGFNPIGNSSINSFQGIFDGNNKQINNIFIYNKTNNNAVIGLFGIVNNITIKNLTVSGEIKSDVRSTMGGIIGENWGGTVNIENCTNKINVFSKSNEWSIGGIIASNIQNGTVVIKNSINYGNISNGSTTGGLIAHSKGVLTIEKSTNYGVITNNLGSFTGGILGEDNTNSSRTIIMNSHNEGIVNGDNNSVITYTGGLVGCIFGNIEINDSYNIGDVTSNGENAVYIGGLIGQVNKKAIINNSYNADNTIKISPNGFNELEANGGLIGAIGNQTEISIIKNSYNKGKLINGNRVGGLIGNLESGIIIDKCYNLGNIQVENEIWTSHSQIGGLIGAAISYAYFHPTDIVLNSYNNGNILANNETTTSITGLLNNLHSNKLILLNSYNSGNLDLQSNKGGVYGLVQSSGQGLQNQSTEKNINILNNVYNIGIVNNITSNKYSLGNFDVNTTTNNIQNTYYLNIENVTGTNLADTGTSMTLDQMKNQAFVDTLNKNIESIDLEKIDPSLKDYKLSKWQLGSDDYPILIND